MELGGSQLNAVQLAAAVRDRGHEVLVLSEPGELVPLVAELGLEHVEIPLRRKRPDRRVVSEVNRLVRTRGIDVVHGYEWPPAFEALYGTGIRRAAAPIATVMSMSVVPFFPRSIPLIVGTEQIRREAVAAGHHRVTLLEPPVDTDGDHPGVPADGFRAAHGLTGAPLIVAVSRLVADLKLPGLLAACDAMAQLGEGTQLAIVGDGPARAEITERAEQANARAGRRAVVLTGQLADPRPAYAAADITIGMGGSALRALSFGKPLVVLGLDGFSELLTRESLPQFLTSGWWGFGGDGVPSLTASLRRLVESPRLRAELGEFGRELVVGRFSLRRAAELQEQEYEIAARTSGTALLDVVRSTGGLASYKVRRKLARLRGRAAVDDANAAATKPTRA
ncbi:glycosyltransferase family 4 protein [Nocardia sp. NRRL S-836]|uniref:glycosyltransferase family 4 protein n=1 Tax=Nocardia sp. NRRL S-836 TaxID=1519492 RepID=UPI0018D1DC3C|nr:glycosyltransferase family 4 protein [Nocardia sp. NRRL S-836]